ncbi:MAG: NTP transferase domain-containing protein [Syntrophomonadaceae bacterium]|jgi:mannose-1-phosphate guanylyltransferase/phosphomannomutase|nr:NTP transferase domain-containing protein [Syntrophomonadaceae bacterium]
MKAVVMAGGEGTRLRPLTCNLSKPMVPVMDKPVMEYALQLLKKYGITDIAVTLQYLPDTIRDYFGDGSEWGLNLHYYVEESPLGTAGSVKNAQEFLDEPFIVISGDALTDFNLQTAIDFHRSQGALATLVLTRVESPLEYGLVLTEESGQIGRFLEKPSWGEVFSDTVNTGIYVLEPDALGYIPENQKYDFSRDLFPRFLKNDLGLFGCILDGYWCDIGSCEQYQQVHLDILDGKVDIDIDAHLEGDIWLGRGVRIAPSAVLEGPCYIGSYCEIENQAQVKAYTVLGEGCVVEKAASTKRTVVWRGSRIGQKAQLRGTVAGKGVSIGRRAGVFEGAVIGDDSVIEAESVVKPNVKIWPHKHIEQGRVIAQSVVWSPRVQRTLFKRGGIKGGFNQELNPEKCARIGRAFGTFLSLPSRTALGYDYSPVSRALRDALASGLLTTGIEVVDTGRLGLAAFRYAVSNLGVDHGIYVRVLDAESGRANIIMVNEAGADLPKRDERKIENLYSREEFRQVPADRVPDILVMPDVNASYLSVRLNQLNADPVKRQRFGLVLAGENEKLTDQLVHLLDALNCKVNRLDPHHRQEGPRYAATTEEGIDAVAEAMLGSQLDLGLYLYDGGQRLALVDRRGRIVRDEDYQTLLSCVFNHRFKTVYLPVNLPLAVEDTIRGSGKTVVRTRSGVNDFMEAVLEGGEREQFWFHVDGLYAAMRLLEYLAEEDLALEELLERMPEFYYHKREIPVPWEYKGRVIRHLAEAEGEQGDYSQLEGVRLEHPQGWSLVLPDDERPVCCIYSEGFSQEIAESLTEFYEDKIREICQEN